MADDDDDKEDDFARSLREVFSGRKEPASLELMANVYADLSNVRDLSMYVIPVLISLCKTNEDLEKLNAFTERVYKFQDNVGKGMNRLLQEGRQKNE